jgi:hypothetical protein
MRTLPLIIAITLAVSTGLLAGCSTQLGGERAAVDDVQVPPPPVIWAYTFGGSAADEAHAFQFTADYGCIIAGSTKSSAEGDSQVYLIKTDLMGEQEWTTTFGGPLFDEARSVEPTADGGYIVAGLTDSFGEGGSDVYLIKTNAAGEEQWSTTFGGTLDEEAHTVRQTEDGGFIVAGISQSFGPDDPGDSDAYLIKTNAAGTEEWSRTFGGPTYDDAQCLDQTDDGGYVLAGRTVSFGEGGSDVYLVKTNGTGEEIWSRTIGTPGNEGAYAVQQTTDGGYILAGFRQARGARDMGAYLVKTDAAGIMEWSQTFGGYFDEAFTSVSQTMDGGYITVGATRSFAKSFTQPDLDGYVVRTDPTGTLVWSTTIGASSKGMDDSAAAVRQAAGGAYYIAGSRHRFDATRGLDAFLLKLGPTS